ncbi:hypothetical protein SMGD1_0995 [Sulfurimonas gotlandica GD1]|uniref:Uncharacterized protein n=1 Tax=Sulfurimonas gotlandica (strain DSM 19862 / JCM 16533 / GD1) TaxID=929558 RepID=H1FY13_SULGG|nr:hypothetical protein [Sulfurimonas gotlandica]EHP29520.1 hypothetical protein SMGD1_0995 [Sulfurimonas gotlandica GD1]
MKAYSIDSTTQEVKEIDIEMQANTVYSFFNSILTDELNTIDKHTIHTDSNAISQNKVPFFIGGQLIIGNALIVGKNGLFDVDASIPKDDLESLVNYDITPFYKNVLNLLKDSDINLYRVFEVTQEQEDIKLNTEWVLYVFNMADDRTKEYFIAELEKAVDAKKDIAIYMQNMAILALNATANQ